MASILGSPLGVVLLVLSTLGVDELLSARLNLLLSALLAGQGSPSPEVFCTSVLLALMLLLPPSLNLLNFFKVSAMLIGITPLLIALELLEALDLGAAFELELVHFSLPLLYSLAALLLPGYMSCLILLRLSTPMPVGGLHCFPRL